jgi:hypothetical protein
MHDAAIIAPDHAHAEVYKQTKSNASLSIVLNQRKIRIEDCIYASGIMWLHTHLTRSQCRPVSRNPQLIFDTEVPKFRRARFEGPGLNVGVLLYTFTGIYHHIEWVHNPPQKVAWPSTLAKLHLHPRNIYYVCNLQRPIYNIAVQINSLHHLF